MYKLILHHVYRSSAPFLDLSGYGTHAQGTNVGWSADGAVPQSGAAVFNGSTSRALVPLSPVWQDLYALRVDALVRFDPVQGTPGHPVRVRRHLVVEGPLSFAVFIGQERTVTGMVMGLLPDPDADDDPSDSDTLTATLSGGGSVDPFDTLVANVPDTLPIPPGYKLGWVPVSSTPEFAPDGRLLVVAGLRRGELAGLKWDEPASTRSAGAPGRRPRRGTGHRSAALHRQGRAVGADHPAAEVAAAQPFP